MSPRTPSWMGGVPPRSSFPGSGLGSAGVSSGFGGGAGATGGEADDERDDATDVTDTDATDATSQGSLTSVD